jgi:hypothetical protein
VLAAVLGAVYLAFAPVVGHGFLNWDDGETIVRNERLSERGVAAWAFRTGFVGHYQPLSWLAWALLRRVAGVDPAAYHSASLVLHLVNTALVFLLAAALARAASLGVHSRLLAATAAALVFGLHPLRVEPVAWASAFPYVLALAPLIWSTLAYLRYARGGSAPWLVSACALYAASTLVRPAAPGFPLVLLVLDAWLGRRSAWRRALWEKTPFLLVGVAGAVSEASARRFASLEHVGAWDRLGAAALSPFAYLGQTLWPAGLTPLQPLPLEGGSAPVAVVASLLLLLLATGVTAWLGRRCPALAACWIAYLVLAAPAAGLLPSGLQATADRYTYLPGVALALLAGGALGRLADVPGRRALAVGLVTCAALGMGLATSRYLAHWRDSVRLWTRALAVDSRNDVALYNLALAHEERNDDGAALARYDELLRLIPEHAPARQNRDRLEARRLEEQAGALAQARRLAEAVDLYSRALALDPKRLHSRRSRGMALAELARYEEAIPDLRAALQADAAEPSVRHALAYALRQSRRGAEAEAVLAAEPTK